MTAPIAGLPPLVEPDAPLAPSAPVEPAHAADAGDFARVLGRALDDVTLALAAATASRTTQALSTILGMQV